MSLNRPMGQSPNLWEELNKLSVEDSFLLMSAGELDPHYKEWTAATLTQPSNQFLRLTKVLDKFKLLTAEDKAQLIEIITIETTLEQCIHENNESYIVLKQQATFHLQAIKFLLFNKSKILNGGLSLFNWEKVKANLSEYIAPLYAKYVVLHREAGRHIVEQRIYEASYEVITAYKLAREQGILVEYCKYLNAAACIDAKTQALINFKDRIKFELIINNINASEYELREEPSPQVIVLLQHIINNENLEISHNKQEYFKLKKHIQNIHNLFKNHKQKIILGAGMLGLMTAGIFLLSMLSTFGLLGFGILGTTAAILSHGAASVGSGIATHIGLGIVGAKTATCLGSAAVTAGASTVGGTAGAVKSIIDKNKSSAKKNSSPSKKS